MQRLLVDAALLKVILRRRHDSIDNLAEDGALHSSSLSALAQLGRNKVKQSVGKAGRDASLLTVIVLDMVADACDGARDGGRMDGRLIRKRSRQS